MRDRDKKITILKPNTKTVTNEAGEDVIEYDDFASNIWASVEPMYGREYLEAQKIRTETTYRIELEYIDGITPDMTVLYNNRKFEIKNVINIKERNRDIQLMCIEKVK